MPAPKPQPKPAHTPAPITRDARAEYEERRRIRDQRNAEFTEAERWRQMTAAQRAEDAKKRWPRLSLEEQEAARAARRASGRGQLMLPLRYGGSTIYVAWRRTAAGELEPKVDAVARYVRNVLRTPRSTTTLDEIAARLDERNAFVSTLRETARTIAGVVGTLRSATAVIDLDGGAAVRACGADYRQLHRLADLLEGSRAAAQSIVEAAATTLDGDCRQGRNEVELYRLVLDHLPLGRQKRGAASAIVRCLWPRLERQDERKLSKRIAEQLRAK